MAETAVFAGALKRGALGEALGVLNRVKVDVAWKVLLEAGFTVGSSASRAEMMAPVQKDIIEAAQRGMTGRELREAREAVAAIETRLVERAADAIDGGISSFGDLQAAFDKVSTLNDLKALDDLVDKLVMRDRNPLILTGDEARMWADLVAKKVAQFDDPARVFYRSVSPLEWEQIQKDGEIKGGLNTFNVHDQRREVFFGDKLTPALIAQGEDRTRQAEYLLLGGSIDLEYRRVREQQKQVEAKTTIRLLAMGYADVESVPQVVFLTDPALKRLRADNHKLEGELDRIRGAYREAAQQKIVELRSADVARGYSSVILETRPLVGGRRYAADQGASMMPDDEYGFDSGAVKLADVARVQYVMSGQVIEQPVRQVGEVLAAQGEHGQVEFSVERDDDDEGTLVLARDTGRVDQMGKALVVGHLHVPDEAVRSETFRIGDVDVQAAYQRRGIATAMLRQMAGHLKAAPVGATTVFSQDGQAFFEAVAKETTMFQKVAARFGVPLDVVADIAQSTPETLIARYRSDEGVMPNGLSPAEFSRFPIGTVRMMDTGGEIEQRYVDFLRELDPATLVTAEAEQGIKQHPTYGQYLQWSREGREAPYISVFETEKGALQSTNRRRTLVAQEIGKPIKGWFGILNRETGNPLKYGDVVAAIQEAEKGVSLSVVPDAPAPTSNATRESEDLEKFIKVAADSVEQLRKVDVLRVLESNSMRKVELARYISDKRADLAQEVDEVMVEEFGLADWKTRNAQPAASQEVPSRIPSEQVFRYAMVNRPIGIGTVPKEGLVGSEDRPPEGAPHHEIARNGVAVFSRQLTDAETKQFEMARMVDSQDMGAELAAVVEYLGEYAEEYAEMTVAEPDEFAITVKEALRSTAKGYPPSVADIEAFVGLVAAGLKDKDNEQRQEGLNFDASFDLRGYSVFYVKDGQVVSAGSVPALGPDHDTNLGKYAMSVADSYGAELYLAKGVVRAGETNVGEKPLIFGMTWEEIQAKQQGQNVGAVVKPAQLPANAVRVYEPQVREFVHSGFRIYPINVRIGTEGVVPRWAVQSIDNAERERRGERQVGGDAIVETVATAMKTAEEQVRQAERDQQLAREEAARVAEAEAKREANRGLSIAERKANSVLDKPSRLPASAGLGIGSMRKAMEMAVEQGRAVVMVEVTDMAAKNRDRAAMEEGRRAGWLLGLSNPNLPGVQKMQAASDRLAQNHYVKPEYRVYAGREAEGAFYEISKTAYDFALSLRERAQENDVVGALDSGAEQEQRVVANHDGQRRIEVFIPDERMGSFQRKLASIQAAAKKLGLPEWKVTAGAKEWREMLHPKHSVDGALSWEKMSCEGTPITIVGNAPVLAGWRFLAKIEHSADGNLIKRMGSDEQSLQSWHSCAPNCEHCNVPRQRNNTFILQNVVTDEVKQVGSSCVSDFLGEHFRDPERIAALYDHLVGLEREFLFDPDRESEGVSLESLGVSPVRLMAATLKIVEEDKGYISADKGEAERVASTGERVRAAFWSQNAKDGVAVGAGHLERAEQVVAWLREQQSSDSLWLRNIGFLAAREAITAKNAGLFASGYVAWNRELQKSLRKERGEGEWVGQPNDKVVVATTLERQGGFDTQYGYKSVLTFRDETGNCLVWKSTAAPDGMVVGNSYHLMATVKGHGEYKGEKQTEIIRAKLPELELFGLGPIKGYAAMAAVASPDVPNEQGHTPLIKAVWADKVEHAQVLLSAGADANQRLLGESPVLAYAQSAEMAQALIGAGARAVDVNDTDLQHMEPAAQAVVKAAMEPQCVVGGVSRPMSAVPEAADNGRYIGNVVLVAEGKVIQDTGRGSLVAHQADRFQSLPGVGDKLDVQYVNKALTMSKVQIEQARNVAIDSR